MKTVSQLDNNNFFSHPTEADESPLEPGVFLIPGGAVNAEPPVVVPGKRYKWNGEQFVAEDIPEPVVEPPVPLTPEELAEKVRLDRNGKLTLCDWTVLSDAQLTTTQKANWKAYRQALRDITDQPGFPETVVWPVLTWPI